jgi:outer membrane protein OmpA-like peptidoglycan-associated protein
MRFGKRFETGWAGLAVALALAASPAAAQAPEPGGCMGKARLRGPLWDTAEAALEPGLDAVLDEIARVIREDCAGKGIVIEGHAFELPTAQLNLQLSELRVTLVRHELEKRGVPPTQLLPVPLGDTRPLVPKDKPGSAFANRRITFRVVE